MLMTGYNLVRGPAVEAFRASFTHLYHRPEPETLSAVALLRHARCGASATTRNCRACSSISSPGGCHVQRRRVPLPAALVGRPFP